MRKSATKRVQLDPAATKVPLEELAGQLGGGAEPVEVVGWRDRRGFLRRARADYPNGWQVTLFFSKPRDGRNHITSWKASMKLKARA